MNIRLRAATPNDSQLVLAWRNDDFIVSRSTSQRKVEPQEHERWFSQALQNPEMQLDIILLDDEPAGLIRLDRNNNLCIIASYLLESFTGRGYGVQAITLGCQAAFSQWQIDKVVACVREDNSAGQKAFLKAGFLLDADESHSCPPAHRPYSLKRLTASQP